MKAIDDKDAEEYIEANAPPAMRIVYAVVGEFLRANRARAGGGSEREQLDSMKRCIELVDQILAETQGNEVTH